MSTLQVVQHEAETVEWWFEQAQKSRLDLEPDFQRRSNLWSTYKQAHLIDSIINGYDLPKFYIADFTLARSALNVSHKPYAVVDGKQRFGAIFAFLRDELRLNKSSLYEADPKRLVKGKSFSDLLRDFPDLAKRVMTFRPVVMSIITEDRAKISEMFIRLNSGEAANSAERRNARPGPIPVLVRELVDHAFFRSRVSFTVKRMADHQLAAKIMLIEYKGVAVDTKAKDIDKFVNDAANECLPGEFEDLTPQNEASIKKYENVAERVINVLELLASSFRERDPLLSTSGRIPVYYLVLRNHPEVVDNFRDFVEDFEARVLDAMRKERAGIKTSGIYATYYTLARTANDQASLRERYKLMVAELRKKNLVV